jgi:hypothetical protein
LQRSDPITPIDPLNPHSLSSLGQAGAAVTADGPTIAVAPGDITGEALMHAIAWVGIFVLALAVLCWLVFKITLWFAGLLFVAGLVLLAWGFTKVKRAV